MTRTILTLEEGDKRWLDRYSGRHGQSTAQTIRLAIKEFQKKAGAAEFKQTVMSVAGIWKGGEDGAETVRKLRKEWD